MDTCDFDRLVQFVNKRMDLDGQLQVYDHLERCDICRDAVCQLTRDRDEIKLSCSKRRMRRFVVQFTLLAAQQSDGCSGDRKRRGANGASG